MQKKSKKCEYCGSKNHEGWNCPFIPGGTGAYLLIPDSERPIEKADRYLRQSGMERDGAKGWI